MVRGDNELYKFEHIEKRNQFEVTKSVYVFMK